MIPNPYNRLKQQLPVQPEIQQFNPAAGAPQMQWQPGVGGEGQGDTQGLGDAAGMLGQYLKKRQGAGPADALAAWKSGGSL